MGQIHFYNGGEFYFDTLGNPRVNIDDICRRRDTAGFEGSDAQIASRSDTHATGIRFAIMQFDLDEATPEMIKARARHLLAPENERELKKLLGEEEKKLKTIAFDCEKFSKCPKAWQLNKEAFEFLTSQGEEFAEHKAISNIPQTLQHIADLPDETLQEYLTQAKATRNAYQTSFVDKESFENNVRVLTDTNHLMKQDFKTILTAHDWAFTITRATHDMTSYSHRIDRGTMLVDKLNHSTVVTEGTAQQYASAIIFAVMACAEIDMIRDLKTDDRKYQSIVQEFHRIASPGSVKGDPFPMDLLGAIHQVSEGGNKQLLKDLQRSLPKCYEFYSNFMSVVHRRATVIRTKNQTKHGQNNGSGKRHEWHDRRPPHVKEDVALPVPETKETPEPTMTPNVPTLRLPGFAVKRRMPQNGQRTEEAVVRSVKEFFEQKVFADGDLSQPVYADCEIVYDDRNKTYPIKISVIKSSGERVDGEFDSTYRDLDKARLLHRAILTHLHDYKEPKSGKALILPWRRHIAGELVTRAAEQLPPVAPQQVALTMTKTGYYVAELTYPLRENGERGALVIHIPLLIRAYNGHSRDVIPDRLREAKRRLEIITRNIAQDLKEMPRWTTADQIRRQFMLALRQETPAFDMEYSADSRPLAGFGENKTVIHFPAEGHGQSTELEHVILHKEHKHNVTWRANIPLTFSGVEVTEDGVTHRATVSRRIDLNLQTSDENLAAVRAEQAVKSLIEGMEAHAKSHPNVKVSQKGDEIYIRSDAGFPGEESLIPFTWEHFKDDFVPQYKKDFTISFMLSPTKKTGQQSLLYEACVTRGEGNAGQPEKFNGLDERPLSHIYTFSAESPVDHETFSEKWQEAFKERLMDKYKNRNRDAQGRESRKAVKLFNTNDIRTLLEDSFTHTVEDLGLSGYVDTTHAPARTRKWSRA